VSTRPGDTGDSRTTATLTEVGTPDDDG